MNVPNAPTGLSRRSWLRDTAIATTGAALLPALLTSCTDHRIPPGTGVGTTPATEEPTLEELQKAAQNLSNMEAWRADLYDWTFRYQTTVYDLINAGSKPTEFASFLVSVFTQVAIGLCIAALAAAETAFPYAAPLITLAGATIAKWALGQDSPNFESVYADFENGHQKVQFALSTWLIDLKGEADNYGMLRKNWNEVYEFNGHTYTLSDLASEKAHFPAQAEGTPYTTLRTAAYDSFRRHIWNVMFVKCAKMYYVTFWEVHKRWRLYQYAETKHYPDYPATYLRGYKREYIDPLLVTYFYFMIDGKYLSNLAAKELFKDDYPGHIVNPDGLFNRDYVFKQFQRWKPDFKGYLDVRVNNDNDSKDDLDPNSDNYVFTGGDFPMLVIR